MKIRSQRAADGFTVIELLVVIVLVCILGLFVTLAYSGVRADNRNGERQNDIDKIKRQLEVYSTGTQTYPTLANLNDPAWRADNLPKLKEGDLHDPHWKDESTDCAVSKKPAFAGKPLANCYSYQVTASDGNTCDNAERPCAHYTLTATLEGGGTYVKGSLN